VQNSQVRRGGAARKRHRINEKWILHFIFGTRRSAVKNLFVPAAPFKAKVKPDHRLACPLLPCANPLGDRRAATRRANSRGANHPKLVCGRSSLYSFLHAVICRRASQGSRTNSRSGCWDCHPTANSSGRLTASSPNAFVNCMSPLLPPGVLHKYLRCRTLSD